jgi:hypothetical protein
MFRFSQKRSYWKLFVPWRSISIRNLMVLHWLVQILCPPQKFGSLPFGMVAAMTINIMLRVHLQWHDIPTNFHEYLPIRWYRRQPHRNRHTDKMISLAFVSFFRKESRVKIRAIQFHVVEKLFGLNTCTEVSLERIYNFIVNVCRCFNSLPITETLLTVILKVKFTTCSSFTQS